MGHLDGKWDKVLGLFYELPQKQFTVREIARETRIPKSTVQGYLRRLKKESFVTDDNRALISDKLRIKKIHFYVERLFESGLISHLEETLAPSCIILFGSMAKGESVHESDIDLFVETVKKQEVDLTPFEKKLKHRIQLFREDDIHKLPERLFNNVVNGIKLKGFVKVR